MPHRARFVTIGALLVASVGAAAPALRAEPVPVVVAGLEPAPDGVDPRALAQRAEDTLRSDRNYVQMRMTITSPRLARPRVVELRSWDDRPGGRAFLRIDAPAKDAGTGFLKDRPNLWMYIPRVERTVRIPPSMMLQSWMGSDFTNDDLVRDSSPVDDYDHRLLGIDASLEHLAGRRAYVIEYRPHEDAPVVWDRIVTWIDTEHAAPLRQDFYDEEGVRLRTLLFEDLRVVDGRFVPHRWSLTPVGEPGRQTVIEVESIDFDAEFDDDLFSTRNLRRGR